MIKIKISLIDSIHPISRVVFIKNDITFDKLHEVIQILFGFENCNYYFFHILKDNITFTDDSDKWNSKTQNNNKDIENAINDKDLVSVINLARERYNHKTYKDSFKVACIDYFKNLTEIVYEYDELSSWQFKIEYKEFDDSISDTKVFEIEGPNLYEEGKGAKYFNTYLSLLLDPNQEVDDEMIDYIDFFGLEPFTPNINELNLKLKKY